MCGLHITNFIYSFNVFCTYFFSGLPCVSHFLQFISYLIRYLSLLICPPFYLYPPPSLLLSLRGYLCLPVPPFAPFAVPSSSPSRFLSKYSLRISFSMLVYLYLYHSGHNLRLSHPNFCLSFASSLLELCQPRSFSCVSSSQSLPLTPMDYGIIPMLCYNCINLIPGKFTEKYGTAGLGMICKIQTASNSNLLMIL